MSPEELKILTTVVGNSSYTSNDFGKNEYIIDMDKSLIDNLIYLIEKTNENAFDTGWEHCRETITTFYPE